MWPKTSDLACRLEFHRFLTHSVVNAVTPLVRSQADYLGMDLETLSAFPAKPPSRRPRMSCQQSFAYRPQAQWQTVRRSKCWRCSLRSSCAGASTGLGRAGSGDLLLALVRKAVAAVVSLLSQTPPSVPSSFPSQTKAFVQLLRSHTRKFHRPEEIAGLHRKMRHS